MKTDAYLNTDRINAIIAAAASSNYVNVTEQNCQDRYTDAVVDLLKESRRRLTVDEARDFLNRLLHAIWRVEPIHIVSDGGGELPDAVECEHWKHLPSEGSTLLLSETFGQEVLYDLLRLIGKEASTTYDEGSWRIENIYNL